MFNKLRLAYLDDLENDPEVQEVLAVPPTVLIERPGLIVDSVREALAEAPSMAGWTFRQKNLKIGSENTYRGPIDIAGDFPGIKHGRLDGSYDRIVFPIEMGPDQSLEINYYYKLITWTKR